MLNPSSELKTPEKPGPTSPDAFDASEESHYSYNRYLRKTFGARTYKVTVNSGLTCPTRDGTISKGGCTFCDVRGSSSFNGKIGRSLEIVEQIDKRLPRVRDRFDAGKFIAYFQSYTNTYSDAGYLREIYTAALSHKDISGLAIGTRPDCLPDSVIDLIEELARTHYVSLELGVQSFEDRTLEWIVRGHDAECSREALRKLARVAPHVQTCAHLIFGCPTDSPTMARDAALELNALGVKGVKLHQLMVLKHTKMAEIYAEAPFPTLSIEAYSELVAEFLEHLSPEIYVERLCALSTHPDECIAPEWSRYRWEPQHKMREIFRARGTRQGSRIGFR